MQHNTKCRELSPGGPQRVISEFESTNVSKITTIACILAIVASGIVSNSAIANSTSSQDGTGLTVAEVSKNPATVQSKWLRLPSGKQIKIGIVNLLVHDDGKKIPVLRYETGQNPLDRQGLDKEVDDLWDLFELDCEQGKFAYAIISANFEPTKVSSNWQNLLVNIPLDKNTVIIRKTDGTLVAMVPDNKAAVIPIVAYNFFFEKRPDGQWHSIEPITSASKIAYRTGLSLLKQGRWQDALPFYDKTIQLDPDYAQAYVDRALVYISMNQPDRAVQDATKAITLNPESIYAYLNRSTAYYLMHQSEKVIDDANKTISLNPATVDAYVNRAGGYLQLGKYQEAIADYNKAMVIAPAYSAPYYDLGQTYIKMGQYEKGIDEMNKALALNPDEGTAIFYHYRALAYKKLGKIDLADNDNQKAKELGYHENQVTVIGDP